MLRCSACRLHLSRASLLYLTILLFSWSLRMEVPYRTALLPSVLSAKMVCPTSLLKDCCSSANYGTFSVKVTFLIVVSCSKFDACTLSSSCLFFPYRLLFPPGLLFPAVLLFLPNLLFPVGLLFSPGSLFPAGWLFLSSMLFQERLLLIAGFLF